MRGCRFHFVAKTLEAHVKHHNSFPPSLTEMLRDANIDAGLLVPLGNEQIEYFAPGQNDSPSKPVLVMTGYGRRVILQKDFERRTDRL